MTQPAYISMVRVSKMNGRKASAESTMTIGQQREANARLIAERGGRLVREFEAFDKSGKTITDSPAWREALALCKAGTAAGLVLAWGDRLSRDLWAVGPYLSELERAGAELLIANMPGVDYRTPMGRAMLNQSLAMADFQYGVYRQRGMATVDRMLEQGVPNSVPYGYRRNERDGVKTRTDLAAKALVPDEDTAEIVRLIFARRTQPEPPSWHKLADELDEMGALLPTAKARGWGIGTLSKIIANRAYLGEINFGNRRIEDAHEALVDRAMWDLAQHKQALTRNGRLAQKGLGLGILRCSGCGGTLSTQTTGAKYGQRVMYSCRRRGTTCQHPTAISRDPVDAWLEKWVTGGITGTQRIALFATAREIEAARVALETQIGEREKVAHMVDAEDWDMADIAIAMRGAKAKVERARAHYDTLLAARQAEAQLPDSIDTWNALSLARKREVLALLIDHVTVLPPVGSRRWSVPTERLVLVERWGDDGQ